MNSTYRAKLIVVAREMLKRPVVMQDEQNLNEFNTLKIRGKIF